MTPASLISEKSLSGTPAGCLFPEFVTETNMKVVKTLCGKDVILDDDMDLPRTPFIISGRYAAFSTGGRGNYIMVHHFVWGKNVYLDHINGNPLDNRLENLRESDASKNAHNQKARNELGLKGVYRCGNKFRASISKDRQQYHLGVFSNPLEAARAYDAKAQELYGTHFKGNFCD